MDILFMINTEVLFLTSMVAGFVIVALSVISLFTNIKFWPPPRKESWQFKIFWAMFVFFSFPYFIILILEFENRNQNNLFFLIGAIISILSLVLANVVSLKLGVKNTSGQKDELKVNGWYSVSRNPIYVLTIAALIGAMVAVPVFEIILISILWIFIYICAPFIEEPWLEDRYGDEYLKYKSRVRRFI